MTDTELQALHPARLCETAHCGNEITARLNEVGIPQSDGPRPAATWECTCGWKRTVPLVAQERVPYGWTSSISYCRRKDDVQPR